MTDPKDILIHVLMQQRNQAADAAAQMQVSLEIAHAKIRQMESQHTRPDYPTTPQP